MKTLTLVRRLSILPAPAARPVAALRATAAGLDADESIRRALLARLERQSWWDAGTSNVYVDRGTVVYQGLVRDAQARRAAREMAQAVPGVVGVWDARVPRREWQAMA